ncbi:unnamed protein product [Protopolystoma xenopodis]|uniref:Uncharacterized protein n=1 Tax=Protopolystoma xenopodis TaxID=117903 RepID=A0A448XLF8_9PLAT|nr:unnamed protein product [Protopolystoma xenopodis]
MLNSTVSHLTGTWPGFLQDTHHPPSSGHVRYQSSGSEATGSASTTFLTTGLQETYLEGSTHGFLLDLLGIPVLDKMIDLDLCQRPDPNDVHIIPAKLNLDVIQKSPCQLLDKAFLGFIELANLWLNSSGSSSKSLHKPSNPTDSDNIFLLTFCDESLSAKKRRILNLLTNWTSRRTFLVSSIGFI